MNIEVVPHGPAFRCGNTSERCKPSHEKIAPWNGNQGLFQTSLEKDIKVPRTYRYETNKIVVHVTRISESCGTRCHDLRYERVCMGEIRRGNMVVVHCDSIQSRVI